MSSNAVPKPIDIIVIPAPKEKSREDAVILGQAESDGTKKQIDVLRAEPITSSAKEGHTGKKRVFKSWRRDPDAKVVGLKNYGLDRAVYEKRRQLEHSHSRNSLASLTTFQNGGEGNKRNKRAHFAVEEKEEEIRRTATKNPFVLFYLGNLAALKVILYYLSKSSDTVVFPNQYLFETSKRTLTCFPVNALL